MGFPKMLKPPHWAIDDATAPNTGVLKWDPIFGNYPCGSFGEAFGMQGIWFRVYGGDLVYVMFGLRVQRLISLRQCGRTLKNRWDVWGNRTVYPRQ